MTDQVTLSAELAAQLQATGLNVSEGASQEQLTKAIEGQGRVVSVHGEDSGAPHARVNEGAKLGTLGQLSEHLSGVAHGSTAVEAIARAYLEMHRRVTERDSQRSG